MAELTDDEADAMMAEWTGDPISRILDDLWSRALGSQAETFVGEDGEVGPADEDTIIRYKTNAIRKARAALDQTHGQEGNRG